MVDKSYKVKVLQHLSTIIDIHISSNINPLPPFISPSLTTTLKSSSVDRSGSSKKKILFHYYMLKSPKNAILRKTSYMLRLKNIYFEFGSIHRQFNCLILLKGGIVSDTFVMKIVFLGQMCLNIVRFG